MDIMCNRLRQRAHVTNACTNCKKRRKKCSGTRPCANCKKRKLECVFIKPNERRGRKPRSRVSTDCGEFSYFNHELSTSSTLTTPQTSTTISSDDPSTTITHAVSAFNELSTHSGFPNTPVNEQNHAISANNNYSISSSPISFASNQEISAYINNNYYSVPDVDYSLSFTTSSQIISINNVQETYELSHEQYQFPNFLPPETCEHNITSDSISLISHVDSLHLRTCEYDFMNDSISLFETNMICPPLQTLQFDPLPLDSFTSDPC
ncbi:22787_t:CDS:2 [Racocetra persica]|uniref:22787_t:CDS:1 n=1 Tax=Racocetra persica TaxID=160502 RepID=A0ACA9LAR5_9GLOM|nr:22787_t:CDS:2 [Racocetra persica]